MTSTYGPVASRSMPAEWDRHEATWIAWPHHEPDWPGKLEPVQWVFADIVRVLHVSERVEILCHDAATLERARVCLDLVGVEQEGYRLHLAPNDRCWLRDSAPTAVRTAEGGIRWVRWRFNAWAKYENYQQDAGVPDVVAQMSKWETIEARRPDNDQPLVLEGGAIDTDGQGTLLTTEECLLSDVQMRNPGLTRRGYERAFADYLGIRKVIWLGRGCAGDDTHGHVDDIARFVGPGLVVVAYESDVRDPNHEPSVDNMRRLREATDASGRPLRIVTLPMPRPVIFEGQRLPASYANFYIANTCVLVPTYNDTKDRFALATLAELFPDRQVVGIHALDLVWGLGTLHCLTQQQPAASYEQRRL